MSARFCRKLTLKEHQNAGPTKRSQLHGWWTDSSVSHPHSSNRYDTLLGEMRGAGELRSTMEPFNRATTICLVDWRLDSAFNPFLFQP
jgi:hypothetical protein